MNEIEIIEHEAIKNVMKMIVINSQSLNPIQKQQALNNIDKAAREADWIIGILRKCGYLS